MKRLLEDPRSRALFDGFGAQWLGVGELEAPDLRSREISADDRRRCARRCMTKPVCFSKASCVKTRASSVSSIAITPILNGTLAAIYGLEKTVTGPEMRQGQAERCQSRGILGMPGILAATSFPNRTSPVKRGVWVLEQVLGEHVPPAPPNVPALEKQDQETVANLTLRQRTELHRTNPVCANCHKILDPIGFGLENFDAIGRWRDRDRQRRGD